MPSVSRLAGAGGGGGYGAAKLFPASDIDLLILLPAETSKTTQEKLERLVGHFWDIGLEIGHSVRTIQECLNEAARRHHGADRAARSPPADRQRQAVRHLPETPAATSIRWFFRQATGQQERYLRFNETPTAWNRTARRRGGLRDLQVIFLDRQVAGYGDWAWAWPKRHSSEGRRFEQAPAKTT